jgi:WD40 repeat protein
MIGGVRMAMLTKIGWHVLALGALAGNYWESAVAQDTKYVDRLGDPLPEEAIARIGSGRLRHADAKYAIFSPDSATLLTVDDDGGIQIWQSSTGKLQAKYHAGATLAGVTFLDQGKTVGALYGDNNLHLVDPKTGKRKSRCKLEGLARPYCAAISPDGKTLAVGRDANLITFHDVATGNEKSRIGQKGDNDLSCCIQLIWSADGKLIAALGSYADETVSIFDVATGAAKFSDVRKDMGINGGQRRSLAMTPAGNMVAVCDSHTWFRKIEAWKNHGGKWETTQSLDVSSKTIHCISWAPNGKWFAVGDWDGKVHLVRIGKGDIRVIQTRAFVQHITFSPDSKTLAATAEDGAVSLWDTETAKPKVALENMLGQVWRLRFSGGSKQIGVLADDFSVWDAASGQLVRRIPLPVQKMQKHSLTRSAISPDGSLLAVGENQANLLYLFDTIAGKEKLQIKGKPFIAYGLAIAPDNQTVFTYEQDQGARARNAATAKQGRAFGLRSFGNRFTTSGDGRFLAVADSSNSSDDCRSVQVFEIATGKEACHILPHAKLNASEIALNFDGSQLAVLTDDQHLNFGKNSEVTIWDVKTARQRVKLVGSTTGIMTFALSTDGRMLATGHQNGSVRLWETATGRERHRFRGHEGSIGALAFTLDDRRLGSSSPEGPVYVWGIFVAAQRKGQGELAPIDLDRAWKDLKGDDSAKAFAALRQLAAAPRQAVGLLKQQLKQAREPKEEQVREWLQQLDNDQFSVRRKAQKELEAFVDQLEDRLRTLGSQSAETKNRVRRLLERLDNGTDVDILPVRGLELLERMDCAESESLLKELAGGAAKARLTREAKAALERRRNY